MNDAETPQFEYHLPVVDDHVFSTMTMQFAYNRRQLYEDLHNEIDRESPDFESFALSAALFYEDELEQQLHVADHMYVMAGLIRRQTLINRQIARSISGIDMSRHRPSRHPHGWRGIVSRFRGRTIERTIPDLCYRDDDVEDFDAVDVQSVRRLVAGRPQDTINLFIQGDYFLPHLYAKQKRYAGYAALRLYGFMNMAAAARD